MDKIGYHVWNSDGWTTLEQKLEGNFEALLNKMDKVPELKVKVCRALDVSPLDEQSLELTVESNQLALEANSIARESNVIALKAGETADKARKDARLSMLAAMAAAAAAFIPLVVSAVTRWIDANGK